MRNKSTILFSILVLSLSANVFAISYFIGGHHLADTTETSDISIQTVLQRGVLKLSSEGRQAFKKNFMDNGDLILAQKQLLSEKRLNLLKKIGEPNFDEHEIQKLTEETADLTSNTQKGMQALFLKTLLELSPEDRKIFSDHLVKHFAPLARDPLLKTDAQTK